MKLRQPPLQGVAYKGDLTDEEAAALERAASPPGWRMDGPEWADVQWAATRLLASRWRRRAARTFQAARPAR